MNHMRMDSFAGVLQAIVAPVRGSGYLQQLPRTRQDLALEETSRWAQGSGSHPRVNTTITTPIRKETLGSPLSERIPYGDKLEKPHEMQQNSANAQGSKIDLPVDNPNQGEKEEWPLKYPISPQHCRRGQKPESTTIRPGVIPAGPLHFTNPVPTLPAGWVEHTHLEGKLYYVRDESIHGAPSTLTIVTDANPRDSRNLRGLENIHRQVVEAVRDQHVRLPKRCQLLIEIYPEQDDWAHVGGYYLADLDNQSIFWVENTHLQSLGLGDKVNFGVFGEQHLKLLLHREFWYHIECYPLPGSIDEKNEYEDLLKHLTFAMLDVSTSPTSTSGYTASECSTFIGSIEKAPKNSRTWPIARIAGIMAELRFLNYYGHPSARLNHLHSFEVEQTEEDASTSATSTEQMTQQSTWRRRVDGLCSRTLTLWYSMVAVWLRLCSVFLFDTPMRHHMTLEDLMVHNIVCKRNCNQFMTGLLDDWQHASFLSTVLLAANMAFLTIPAPQETTYSATQLSLLQLAAYTCSLFSTIFSIGSITLGLINTRKHRGVTSSREIADLLAGASHRRYGFRPLAIIYALPIASLEWAVVSFAGAIALYCLIATSIIPRVAVLALGTLLIGCTVVTVWYFWQRETRWGYDVEGASPKRRQRL